MSKSYDNQRVMVYIDGYNLYYGQRESFSTKYKWLDLQAFSESFLQPGMELIAVKYFTAQINIIIKEEYHSPVFPRQL